ncbi:MAG: CBS domain-containing protein [Alphaproteobacteria bacterium]
MKASEIMTRGVRSVPPDATVEAVASLLLAHAISAVPVVDPAGIPLGVVSEADFVRRPELSTEKRRSWWLSFVADPQGGAEEFVRSHGRTAADVMHRGIVATGPDAELAQVAELLDRKHVKRVFVVEDGAIAGVISRSDFVRAVAAAAKPAGEPGARSDSELREEIERRMGREPWAPRALVTVVVSGGIVELLGMVTSEPERAALRLLVREVQGVRDLHDHLVVRQIPFAVGVM